MAVDLNKLANRKPKILKTSEIEAMNERIFAVIAARLDEVSDHAAILSDAVRSALSTALAEAFGPGGGVWLVWCDGEGDLKMNPIAYEADDAQET